MDDRNSDAGSQFSASSSGSSAATSATQARINATVFPLFSEVDYVWPEKMVLIGFLVETFQLFGFVLSVHWAWGDVMDGIGIPIYFLHLPFWDPKYEFYGEFIATTIVFWILTAAIVALVVIVFVMMRYIIAMEQIEPRLTFICRGIHNALGGFLFIPAMHVFLSMIVCKTNDYLWAYPDEKCWEGISLAHFIVGVIGLGVLIGNAFCAQCVMYNDHPKTAYLTGRAHYIVEELYLGLKVALVVLYHSLAMQKHPQVYTAVVAILTFVVAVAHCFYLPFYKQIINRARAAALFLTSYIAFLACLQLEYASKEIASRDSNWDTLLVVVGGFIVVYIGDVCCNLRVNRECVELLDQARVGEAVDNEPQFPRNLPRGERTPVRDLEGCFIDPSSVPTEADLGGDSPDDVSRSKETCVASPYLHCVYAETDIEVCTRFLQFYTNLTGLYPKSLMVAFALRIYAKGLVKFHDSCFVPYHYACFLCYFTVNRLQIALGMLDFVSRFEMSQALNYRVYRMSTSIKSSLGVRDNAQKKILQTALRMHLDALTNISLFWNRLLGKQVEGAQLANIAKLITDRREEGHRQFERLITENTDHNIMSRYAVFLEEVMMDREASNHCRDIICDQLEMQQNRIRGIKTGPVSANQVSTTMLQKRNVSVRGSHTIHRLSVNMNMMFFALFCCLVGLLVFGILVSQEKDRAIETMHYAGEVRMLTQKCAYLSDLVLTETVVERAYQACISTARDVSVCEPSHLSSAQANLRTAVAAYRTAQSLLTKGKYKTTFPQHVQMLRSNFFTLEYWVIGGSAREYAARGLWVLGLQLASAYETIASTNGATSEATDQDVQFLHDNVHNNVARAFNASLTVYEAANADMHQSSLVAFIILYIVSLSVIVVVYYILKLNFQKIGAAKLATLNLFTLIPTAELDKLQDESRRRVRNFGELDPVLQKMKQDRGIDVEFGEGQDADIQRLKGRNRDDRYSKRQEEEMDDDVGDTRFSQMKENMDAVDFGRRKKQERSETSEVDTHERLEELDDAEDLSPGDIEEEPIVSSAYTLADDLRFVDNTEDEIEIDAQQTETVSNGEPVVQERVATTSTALIFVYIALFFAAAGALCLALLGVTEITKIEDVADHTFEEIDHVSGQYDDMQLSRFRAEDFVVLGNVDDFAEYYATTLEMYKNERTTRMYDLDNDDEVFEKWTAMLGYAARVSKLLDISVRLAASGHQLQNTDIPRLYNDFTWNVTRLRYDDETMFARQYLRQPSVDITTDSADLARPPAAQLEASLGVLFSDRFFFTLEMTLEPLRSLWTLLVDRDVPTTYLRAFVVGVIGLTLFVVVGCMMAYKFTRDDKIMKEYHLSRRVLNISMLTSFIALAVFIVLFDRVPTYEDLYDKQIEVLSRVNATRQTIRTTLTASRSFAVTRDQLEMDRFDVYTAEDVVAKNLEALRHLDLTLNADHYEDLSAVEATWLRCSHMAKVSLVLSAWSRGLTVPYRLDHFRWNMTSENDYEIFHFKYSPQEMYSDFSQDAQRSPDNKKALARAIVFGRRFQDNFRSALRTLETASRSLYDTVRDEMDDEYTRMQQLCVVGVVFAGLALFSLLIFGYMYAHAQLQLQETDGSSKDALFDSLTRRSRIALLLISLTISAVLVVVMLQLASSRSVVADLNASSKREFMVARSLVIVNRMVSQDRKRNEFVLQDLAMKMEENRDRFYFGEEGDGGYSAVGVHSTQDQILFGPDVGGPYRDTCPAYVTSSSVEAETQTLVQDLGVDIAQRRWIYALRMLRNSNTTFVTNIILPTLTSMSTPLLYGLRNSTVAFEDKKQNEVSDGFVIYVVIVSITLVIFIYEQIFVFRPMLQMLLNEEEGTKLMLRMIPLEVRETVPAIAEYLETGVITQDKKVQIVNDAITELSTVPTISIDFGGSILSFSKAAEEAFGYERSEVIGRNIKMLMPEAIAREHDSYLANYRRSGIKRVIGKARKARAQRKDGSLFPVELCVREFKFGKDTTFIGCVRNISIDIDFERANLLSNAVSEAATVPIICINTKGLILRFNSAAEQTFLCKAQEVIGHNIKILMPTATAEQHDGYLSDYLRTGVKHVIDKRRKVKARRRGNGELFHAIVSVRELKENGVYIGYVEDQTREYHLQLASMVNDAISQTSPTPLVVINIQGIVLNWNPAAAQTFGFSIDDMVNKNIKAIMPDNVAMKHDLYLQTYQRTGRKKVIDAVSEFKAKRREDNGAYTTLSVSLFVKEISQRNKPMAFVGYIQDMTESLQLNLESRISSTITNLSSIPIIVMSTDCTVLTFSEAACQKFGYGRNEVVGHNIKMLMPEVIAKDHDAIVSKYLETGIKTIIDSTRRVTAMKKSLKEFPIEVSVKEVKFGEERIFVGFARDVTQEFRMLQANATNDAITQLSVVPIFVINIKGVIQACSDSAVDKFGWAREELIGQNVTIIIPDKIAVKHDEYLERYHNLRKEHGDRAIGMSNVVNKKRRVTGKMRDDTQFPVEIQVREIHRDGADSIYVGLVTDLTEEIELRTQRVIAETIIEASTLPLISITRHGLVRVFNRAAEREFGYGRDEVLGKNVNMLMPDDISVLHDGFLKSYAKTGERNVIGKRSVFNGKKKSGDTFPIEMFVSEVIEKDAFGNKIPIFLGFMRDLTQQMLLDQTTMISEVVSELSTTPIVVINSKGIVQEFNAAASRDFGYDQAEVLHQNIKMLMPEEISKNHDGYLARYMTTREKRVVDRLRTVTARRKDGETFPAEISVREVRKDGSESTFIGFVRDMTAQQEIELQTKNNETLIDLSVVPIIGITMKGIITVFSRAAEDAWGYEAKELIGRNIKMLMPDHIAIKHDQFLRAYEKTGEKHVVDSERVVSAKHKDGHDFPVSIAVKETTIMGNEKTFIGYVRSIEVDIQFQFQCAISDELMYMSPIPLVIMTSKGIVTAISESAEAEFGYSRKELVGQNVNMIQTDDIARLHDAFLRRYLEGGSKRVVDKSRRVNVQRKDGTKYSAELLVKEIHYPGNTGGPLFMGFVRNIATELEVRDASKVGDVVALTNPLAIISITSTGTVRSFNPAACQLLGFAEDEVVGKNVKMIMPEEIAVEHDDYLSTYKRTRVKHIVDTGRVTTARHKDGTLVVIEIFVTEINIEGLDDTFVAYVRDVRGDNKLAFTRSVNDAVTGLFQVPIISIDHTGKILSFSETAVKTFGWTEQEAIGQNVKILTPPEIAIEHDDYLTNYFRTGEKKVIDRNRSVTGMRRDGTTFPAEIAVKEYKTTAGTSVFLGFVRDTTMDNFTPRLKAILDCALESLSSALFRVDAEGIIEACFGAAERMYGSAEAFVGQSISTILPYADEDVEEVLRDESPRRMVGQAVTGTQFPVEVTCVAGFHEDGSEFFLLHTRPADTDVIIDGLEAENAVILELLPDAAVLIDRHGTITAHNEGLRVLFDIAEEVEIIGQPITLLMADELGEQHQEFIERFMANGSSGDAMGTTRVVTGIRYSDKLEIPVNLTLQQVTVDRGNPTFIGVMYSA
eukprot:PhM_4_TR16058/c0_g1_i1/m.98468